MTSSDNESVANRGQNSNAKHFNESPQMDFGSELSNRLIKRQMFQKQKQNLNVENAQDRPLPNQITDGSTSPRNNYLSKSFRNPVTANNQTNR